ncbi:hypothetical protein D5038_04625 [Verminephrobacter aporrectodeae subsp. tuberculatae]|nr:hypothetical protein [Verminephrobacter aporrectodeae subsp. tuberculatae]
MGRGYYYGGWAPYIPVAQRQRQAKQKAAALKKQGYSCQPVTIEGRAIAKSFWGKAWCDNLEAYSDYSNRLPRGRTYVRNGSVIDLRIETGKVKALVSGSEIYTVEIGVQPLVASRWDAITKECAGKIDSLIELLQGRLSKAVMETVTRHGEGLFPQPKQISLRCSCPDGASMCKHVAAALYGVGARLDEEPELLFQLRHVDPQELAQKIGSIPAVPMSDTQAALDGSDLSALFGIDIDDASAVSATPPGKRVRAAKATAPPAPLARTGKAAAPSPTRSRTVAASALIARGVARHMIQNWIARGVLLRTGQRGVYGTTAQTETRIAAYLARAV